MEIIQYNTDLGITGAKEVSPGLETLQQQHLYRTFLQSLSGQSFIPTTCYTEQGYLIKFINKKETRLPSRILSFIQQQLSIMN